MRFYHGDGACQSYQADIPRHARWTHACSEALTLQHMRKQFRITLWEVVLTGDIKSWHKAANWRDTLHQLSDDVYLYNQFLENSFYFHLLLLNLSQPSLKNNRTGFLKILLKHKEYQLHIEKHILNIIIHETLRTIIKLLLLSTIGDRYQWSFPCTE